MLLTGRMPQSVRVIRDNDAATQSGRGEVSACSGSFSECSEMICRNSEAFELRRIEQHSCVEVGKKVGHSITATAASMPTRYRFRPRVILEATGLTVASAEGETPHVALTNLIVS